MDKSRIIEELAQKDKEPGISYRIEFATNNVMPKELPEFPYISTELNWDCVVYVCIVSATTFALAIAQVMKHWPDARARQAEEGITELPQSVPQTGVIRKYGAYRTMKKPLHKRIFGYRLW